MRSPADFIATRALGVDASGIRKVFDLAASRKDPSTLRTGIRDSDVPAPAKQAAIEAIQTGQNRYTQTQGIAPLRERLRKDLSTEIGRDIGEVLITSGVSGGLFLAILATINPGDEAIFLDPYFVMYKHLLTLAGGKAGPIDSYPDFRFHPDRVEAAIPPRTKLLILNSPSNPTGVVMNQDEVNAAVSLAKKHDLLIISDEIYEPFLYAKDEGGRMKDESEKKSSSDSSFILHHSSLPSAAKSYDRTIILRGFSKSHAMTGWRLGYAAWPEAILSQMTKLQQYTYVCAPSPLQYAALAALDIDMSTAVAAYQIKRDIAFGMLSKKFEVAKPQGAFYIFPKAPGGMTASAFVERAIAANVLIIPGNVFSEKDTHFRISYATSDERLRQGCEILNSLA